MIRAAADRECAEGSPAWGKIAARRDQMTWAFTSSSVLIHLNTVQVCNHPDLFEGRPIVSAFDAPALELQLPAEALRAREIRVWDDIDLEAVGLVPTTLEGMAQYESASVQVNSVFTSRCYATSNIVVPANGTFCTSPPATEVGTSLL